MKQSDIRESTLSALAPFTDPSSETFRAGVHLQYTGGSSYAVATDGHTMAVIRLADAEAAELRAAGMTDSLPCPWTGFLAAERPIGTWSPDGSEAWRHLPAKWSARATLHAGPQPRATYAAGVPARTGKGGKVLSTAVEIVPAGTRIGGWNLDPRSGDAVTLNVDYLQRVAAFMCRLVLSVDADGALDPVWFRSSPDPIRDCRRVALVMPMRP